MLQRFEHFTYNINEISLYWHRIAAGEMKRYGLKGSCAIYFIKLYNHPEGITAAELGPMCGKDKADVSREIADLEKRGLMKRASSEKRGYRVPIVLTEQGMEYAKAISRKAELAAGIVGKSLSKEEGEQFHKSLEIIASNLRLLSEEGLTK